MKQRHNELLEKTTDSAKTNEDSGTSDSSAPYTTVRDQTVIEVSSFDRIANVSVNFPCLPAAAELTERLRSTQKKNRQTAKTSSNSHTALRHSSSPDTDVHMTPRIATPSLASQRSSLTCNIQTTSFDVLPDSLITWVFSFGLNSYDLCRCALVCRRWNTLIWNVTGLWMTVDFSYHETLDVDKALRTVTRALSRWTPRLCLGVEAVLLHNCRRLTDDGLRAVARRCVDLRRLDISWCGLITNSALFDVLSRCVNLQHLDVTGLPLFSYLFLLSRAF